MQSLSSRTLTFIGIVPILLAGGLATTACQSSPEIQTISDLPPDVVLTESKEDSQFRYETFSGCAKQDYLWQRGILPTAYHTLPSLRGTGNWLRILDLVRSFFSLNTSFDHISDQMPANRVKVIHTYGAVVEVLYLADADSPYSGLWAEPSVCGLARLSLAGDPLLIGYTPGMAIKLFVDGKPSVNLHVMHSLNGQGSDQNFFAHDFTNRIPRPTGVTLRLLEAYFATAKPTPTELPVNHVAQLQEDGSSPHSARVPYQVVFRPTLPNLIDSATTRDFRSELTRVPVGTVLYDVFARPADGAALRHIGKVVTQSTFVASRWGDEGLFFRHNR